MQKESQTKGAGKKHEQRLRDGVAFGSGFRKLREEGVRDEKRGKERSRCMQTRRPAQEHKQKDCVWGLGGGVGVFPKKVGRKKDQIWELH